MRHPFLLVLGLSAMLSTTSARTMAERQGSISKENQVTTFHGVRTERVEGGTLKIDITGKGAVLCSWGLLQAAREVGLACHKGENLEFQTEVQRSTNRIDEFIIANAKSATKKTDLALRHAEVSNQLQSSGDLCTADAARLYDNMRVRGAATLQAQTTELLSIPREPVMNPCL